MLNRLKLGITVLGAAALASSVFTDALASNPSPFRPQARTASNLSVSGNLTVNNVARVNKNMSVYGRFYAHGGEQVWKTLTVKNGGLNVTGGTTTDSLTTPTLSVSQQANISGNAAVTGALTAGSLTSTGGITAPSLTLSANGKNTAVGVDANGNLTLGSGVVASGALTAGSLSAGSITTTGALTAGSLTTAGTLTAGGLTITGPVDFSKATVTGLSASSINLQNLSLQSLSLGSATQTTPPLALTANGQTETLGIDQNGALTVRSLSVSNTFTAGSANFSALSLGNTSATTPALTLAANGKSTQIGVDANGNLTVGGIVASGAINATGGLQVGGNATVGGSLSVTGTGGLVASTIAAPAATSGGTTPGALTLNGSSIGLNGATTANGTFTVGGGNDLVLSAPTTSTATASHIVAGGSKDVAGVATISFGSSSYGSGAAGSATVCFTKAYSTSPIVTLTADGDPAPDASATPNNAAPKVYVQTFGPNTSNCTNTGGFVIRYVAPAGITAPSGTTTILYFYHVIGS